MQPIIVVSAGPSGAQVQIFGFVPCFRGVCLRHSAQVFAPAAMVFPPWVSRRPVVFIGLWLVQGRAAHCNIRCGLCRVALG